MGLDCEPLRRVEAIESEKFDKNRHEVSNDEHRSDDCLEIIAGKLCFGSRSPWYVTKHLGLTDLLQAQQPALKSQAVVVKSVDLRTKIDLLEQNVESLMNQDRSMNKEIQEVKSNFETVKNGLTNQIQQISVSL